MTHAPAEYILTLFASPESQARSPLAGEDGKAAHVSFAPAVVVLGVNIFPWLVVCATETLVHKTSRIKSLFIYPSAQL
jgi:hypothetical protein